MTDLARLPHVEGVLSAAQVAQSAASIAAMQEPWGAVPWTVGEHVDIWNHVEAAMAMLVGGEVEAAETAYAWVPTMQRADGSWPMKIVAGPNVAVMGKPFCVEDLEAAIEWLRGTSAPGVDDELASLLSKPRMRRSRPTLPIA